MASKVFLIQKSRRDLDLTPAESLGDIVTVLGPMDSPSIALAPSLIKVRQSLKDYNPDTDYLLAAGGDQLSSFLAGSVLTDMGFLNGENHINWLRWNRNRDLDGRRDMRNGEYKSVSFNLNGPYKGEWE